MRICAKASLDNIKHTHMSKNMELYEFIYVENKINKVTEKM